MKRQDRITCELVVLAALLAAGCSSTTATLSGPSPAKCSVATTLSPVTVGPDGGSGRATVTTARECAWAASSDAAWILITEGQSGQGDGAVSYEVAANPSPVARSANIAVNDQRVALTQNAAPCRFTLDHTSAAFQSQGGSDSVAVATTSPCEWTARSLASWISITSGATGAGAGTVAFSVAGSSGARSGEILIAGQTFTVEQGTGSGPAPPSCSTSINPTQLSVSAAGGPVSVGVSAAPGCTWGAASATAWLTVRTNSGIGPGTVQVDVAANTATTARTGSATIAGGTFTVPAGGSPA